MQVTLKKLVRCRQQNTLLGICAVVILASGGCKRLGTAVTKYLPAKAKQVALQDQAGDAAESNDSAPAPDTSPMQNMGGEPTAGDPADPVSGGGDDGLQNFGPENGESFDPANDVSLEADAGVGTGPEMDPLEGDGTDQLEDPGTFVDGFSGGSVADPAGEPQGDPGLTPTGEDFPETNNGPTGQPAVGPPGAGGSRKGRQTSKRGRNSAGGRQAGTNPNNMRIEEPQGRPLMRLTANAAAPATTREGQRIGFSVEYQLQGEGLSPSGEYGLLIESAKNGRYGTAVRLGEEGTLQVPAVAEFRPTSGPFKAYLVQKTKTGVQRISNIVQFKTLY